MTLVLVWGPFAQVCLGFTGGLAAMVSAMFLVGSADTLFLQGMALAGTSSAFLMALFLWTGVVRARRLGLIPSGASNPLVAETGSETAPGAAPAHR